MVVGQTWESLEAGEHKSEMNRGSTQKNMSEKVSKLGVCWKGKIVS